MQKIGRDGGQAGTQQLDGSHSSGGVRKGVKIRRDLVQSEILEKASQLFANQGYDGTSLQEIADAVGIKRTALYNYISNKEELLSLLVADVSERTAERIHALRVEYASDSIELLKALVRMIVLERAAEPTHFRMLDRIEPSLPESIAQEHREAKRVIVSETIAILREGSLRGQLHVADERVAALSLLGMCNWVAWWFRPGPDHPSEPVAEQMAQQAVAMLAHPEALPSKPLGMREALGLVHRDLMYLEKLIPSDAGH